MGKARNSFDDDEDDFEYEHPLLEPFTQLGIDKPSTSKCIYAVSKSQASPSDRFCKASKGRRRPITFSAASVNFPASMTMMAVSMQIPISTNQEPCRLDEEFSV